MEEKIREPKIIIWKKDIIDQLIKMVRVKSLEQMLIKMEIVLCS